MKKAESNIVKILESWLIERLPASDWHWLEKRLNLIRDNNADRDLVITLGLIPRKLARADLSLTQQELATANTLHSGWEPTDWSIGTTARILALRLRSEFDEGSFGALFSNLCKTADLSESIALYSGVFLYPDSEMLDYQIGEGLRTNIKAVFETIAHKNPYPCDKFDQNRWNHMVLKALFIDSSLTPIVGLDQRANAELATMLVDYAHERWAAKRAVSAQLWRCVGPFAQGRMLDDLAKVAGSQNLMERQSAVLALSQSLDENAKKIIADHPELAIKISSGMLTWDQIHM